MPRNVKKLAAATSIAFGSMLAGCVTPQVTTIPDGVFQTFPAEEIITGGVRDGSIELADGCLYLKTDRWNYIVFFPDGSAISADRKAVLLPDGDTIVVGEEYRLLLEYYPSLQNTNSACIGDANALVRSIARGE